MSLQELVERYRRDGFIAVEGVYPPEQMEELRRTTDGFVERSREATGHTDMFDLEPGHTAEHPRLRRLKNPVRFHEAYDRCMREPARVCSAAYADWPARSMSALRADGVPAYARFAAAASNNS